MTHHTIDYGADPAALRRERERLRERCAVLESMLAFAIDGRCPICGWKLAPNRESGCVPGDCSFRPGATIPCPNVPIDARRRLAAELRGER